MTFQDGWLRRQILAANEEINSWSDTKREVMLREDTSEPARIDENLREERSERSSD